MKKLTGMLLFAISTAVSADMNDEPLLLSVMADKFEYRKDGGESVTAWDFEAWYGTTRDRLAVRSEGEADSAATEAFDTTLVWSRAIAPFWNVNAGWRGDWQPGQRRHWAAVELEGLAPGFVETRVSLLAGSGGRWAARAEFETTWRLSRWLELAPIIETDWYRRADVANGLGAGITGVEAGVRLKFRIRPDFKPYVGFNGSWLIGDTADLARAGGSAVRHNQVVAGLSFWF